MKKNDVLIDAGLVLDFQSGNQNALAILVKRWHKLFCEKAYWVVKDADLAKDIAQESWQIIIYKLKELRDVNSFGSWASQIVYSKSIDAIRINQKNRKLFKKNKIDKEVISEEETNNDHIKKVLMKAVKSLSENQQVVIRLFYVEDYSLKEISDILNISIGTTKSRLFHAREKLKLTLKHRNYEN